MVKVYISGAVSNIPEKEYTRKFKCSQLAFEWIGCKVINPVEIPVTHDRSWKAFMKVDLLALKDCDTIFMMNCWKGSRGAKIEHWFALRYGKRIIYQP